MRHALAFLALALLAEACGAGAPPPPPPKPKMHKLGDDCAPGEQLAKTNCDTGLVCMPWGENGLCTSQCPCGAGATCADSLRVPELCYKACSADSDCRGGEGYLCDPSWKVCAPVLSLAIKSPQCETPAPAPPRKAFGKVHQLSTARGSPKGTFSPAALLDKDNSVEVIYEAGVALAGTNNLAISKLDVDKAAIDGDRELRVDRQQALHPAAAVDRNGRIVLVWHGFDGGYPGRRTMIGLSTTTDGYNWARPVIANDISTDCPNDRPDCVSTPSIAIGPDLKDPKRDAMYVMYFSSVTKTLRMTRTYDGASFSPSAGVGLGGYGDALVTSSGKVHVVYGGGTGEGVNLLGDARNSIYYTNSDDGGQSFRQPVKVSAEGEGIPFYFGKPKLIADFNRAILYAVYPAGSPDGRWEIILATSVDGGLTWKRTTVNDDGPCASHMLPTATLDSAGRIHVMWIENRSGMGSVAYSVCQPNATKCSANEIINDQPFAAYGFARYSSKSVGDGNALIFDAKRKMIHAVWTQPIDEGGNPVSRVFVSSAKLSK